MDNLVRNAMLAKQAGMSYGKWKAMQPPAEAKKKEIPDGWYVSDAASRLSLRPRNGRGTAVSLAKEKHTR